MHTKREDLARMSAFQRCACITASVAASVLHCITASLLHFASIIAQVKVTTILNTCERFPEAV
jgi:hypothetical protein